MPAARFVVSGRVQGVGFRAFVQNLAQRLGVGGEVWNRRDGFVELIASHSDGEVLAEFEQALWIGPGMVGEVIRTPLAEADYSDFEIGLSR